MTLSREQLTRVLVAFVFLTSLSATAAIGAAAPGDSSVDEYTLKELRESGDHIPRAPPSVRWLGENKVFVDHDYTNPIFRSLTTEDWQIARLLRPGSTVRLNEVRLRFRGEKNSGTTRYIVHVVYYQTETYKVEENGTVYKRERATNVTHEQKNVTFAGAYDRAEIDLRPHYDEPYRVTMWVEGYDGARWRFKHNSVETSRQVSTTTAGDRLWWLLKDFVVWLLLFGFLGAGFALIAVRRAGTGPMIGMFWWGMIIIVVSLFALLFNFNGIASLFIRGPKVLAFLVIGFLEIPLLEGQDDRVKKILALQPKITEGTLASGTEGLDAVEWEEEIIKITDTASGRNIRVSSGPIKFLARVAGAFAEIPKLGDRVKTNMSLIGSTGYDSLLFIDPNAEEVTEYEAESFSLTYPDTVPQLAFFFGTMGGLGVILLLTMGSSSLWLLGLAGLPFVLSVEQGHADIHPAPAHMRPALATILYMSKEVKEAQTVEDATEEMIRERAKTTKDVQDQVEQRDETLISEAFEGDVSAVIEEEEIPELEDEEVNGDG